MNYIILNDREYFEEKIHLKNFKEVSLNGRERCDGVFGTVTQQVLEQNSGDERFRDKFFKKGGLLGNRGLEFIVFKIPQNLLHLGNTELISNCLGLIDENDFFTQVWSYCHKNTWEYFLIGIKKSHGVHYLYETKIDSDDDSYGMNIICQKIEECFC